MSRLNGRLYEAAVARRERREPKDLYHSALRVTVPEGEFVIEQAWPIPDANGSLRGVVAEGAVGWRRARALRLFRYEVRRWRGGVIADADEAVDSPQRLERDDPASGRAASRARARRADAVVWGRDELARPGRCGTRTR